MAIDFRPLAESDLPRLAGWLKADHVQEWWRDPSDLERVQAKYLPRIRDEEPTEVFVITVGAEAIGVIQRYRLSDFPAWDGTVAGTGLAFEHSAGIDYLIGERVHLGRGLGTQSIEQFTDRLFADWSDIEEVVVTPQAANRPSCRALEKAGYALRWTGRLDSHDPAYGGVTALYTRRRSSWARQTVGCSDDSRPLRLHVRSSALAIGQSPTAPSNDNLGAMPGADLRAR